MATLVLSAIGSLIGGPLGGALGALLGRQVDHAIIGSPRREGPHLKELAVTTSSYGAAIARHHGRVRAAGTVIWATELSESTETSGGKGGSVTAYSYTSSFAVALSSRPIREVRRIWADGNLLRGAAGDLKVGGTMRLYRGYGDQPVDPLIASDKGANCPAFRNIAYAVFEDLQLADFGNRIPALSFEIVADDGEVTLAQIMASLPEAPTTTRALPALQGFSVEGGSLGETLAVIDSAYPLAIDAGGSGLIVLPADDAAPNAPILPPPAAAADGETFGESAGMRRSRAGGDTNIPDMLRYYDAQRDYLAGLQRADGRARPGRGRSIDFPGTLSAPQARALINAAAERAAWARETLSWRLAEIDPALHPGRIVRVPGHAGNWRIMDWEWNDRGIELELMRMPRGPARQPPADPGAALSPPDLLTGPTILQPFELPWDGNGAGDVPAIFTAASSPARGWGGAALYVDHGDALVPLGGSGSRRSIIGHATAPVPPSPALLLERQASVEIALISTDFALPNATTAMLAAGANRALLGGEIIQFAHAQHLGAGSWRISGLLRGRGGTEGAALAGHPAGAPFVLLDTAAIPLDVAKIAPAASASITAIGRGDSSPVSMPITNPGITLRPLTPVHPRIRKTADGSLSLDWSRRARGAWGWHDQIETPLAEQAEAWRVGVGPPDAPLTGWDTTAPTLTLDAATVAALKAAHPGAEIWVRQIGSFALSDPLLLAVLD